MFSTVFRKKVATAAAAGRENEKNLSQWSARFFSPPLSLFFIIFYFGISREKRKEEEEEGSLPAIRETPPGLGRVRRGGSKLISLSSLLCWLLLSLSFIYIYIYFQLGR